MRGRVMSVAVTKLIALLALIVAAIDGKAGASKTNKIAVMEVYYLERFITKKFVGSKGAANNELGCETINEFLDCNSDDVWTVGEAYYFWKGNEEAEKRIRSEYDIQLSNYESPDHRIIIEQAIDSFLKLPVNSL